MSYKSENWKDKLAEVRAHGNLREGSLEKSADDIINKQIEEDLTNSFNEEESKPETCESCGQDIIVEETKEDSVEEETPAEEVIAKLEEVVAAESNDSPEKTIEKLTEKNMLGRLAKQLQLNEQGKQKMFNYFEKGELQQ